MKVSIQEISHSLSEAEGEKLEKLQAFRASSGSLKPGGEAGEAQRALPRGEVDRFTWPIGGSGGRLEASTCGEGL